MELIRTHADHPDFKALIVFLDANLRENDGDEHAYYAQYNKPDLIEAVVIAYKNGIAAGCGAFKKYSPSAVEIKRMYVQPEFRGQGVASGILTELEKWAKALGFTQSVLETGKKQTEAVRLYPKHGYEIIPNYGQYANMENSICMKKKL